MESHPIPQDVTGFQFKLIGDMTVKQFAYIASGIIIAWILFSMPFSKLIALPFALFVVGTGFALAFLPVEGRPFDVMIMAFIKALFTPNQYLFKKAGSPVIPEVIIAKLKNAVQRSEAMTEEELQNMLIKNMLRQGPKNVMDEKETAYLQTIGNLFTGATIPQSALVQSPTSLPVQQQPVEKKEAETKKTEETEKILEHEASLLKEELEKAKQEEIQEPQNNTQGQTMDAHQKVLELEKMLRETLEQKKELEQKLLQIEQQLPAQKPASSNIAHVRKITKDMGKAAGLPSAIDFPNLLSGIVKDPRGNVLPNILIEVKDKESNPVRAFKTNQLGQFSSATPLLNGTYTITLEDSMEKQTFDQIELTAKGEVITPIEIISHDEREELRKFLFQ